ncbi:MAG: HNH endonuclease [Acidimicrobiales bacterium]
MLKAEGRAWKAHRLAWQLAHGELPAGVRIVQTCHNAACCRPECQRAPGGHQRRPAAAQAPSA